ncbi:MAG: hypothetical protein WCT53_03525 [Candidatus Gracilibacteria bacterium]
MANDAEPGCDIEQEESHPTMIFVKGAYNPFTDPRIEDALSQAKTTFIASPLPDCNVTAITGNVPRVAFSRILKKSGIEVVEVDELHAQSDSANQLIEELKGISHRNRNSPSIIMGSRIMSPNEAIMHVAMDTGIGRELVSLYEERVRAETPGGQTEEHPICERVRVVMPCANSEKHSAVAKIIAVMARVRSWLSSIR